MPSAREQCTRLRGPRVHGTHAPRATTEACARERQQQWQAMQAAPASHSPPPSSLALSLLPPLASPCHDPVMAPTPPPPLPPPSFLAHLHPVVELGGHQHGARQQGVGLSDDGVEEERGAPLHGRLLQEEDEAVGRAHEGEGHLLDGGGGGGGVTAAGLGGAEAGRGGQRGREGGKEGGREGVREGGADWWRPP